MRPLIKILPVMMLLLFAACKVNESLYIDEGRSVRGTQQAINGSVIVGDHCQVKGVCRSINGGVTIGTDSRIKGAMAINGGITLESGVDVMEDVVTINGRLRTGEGVHISGKVKVVNGGADLAGTKVDRDVSVNNGNVTLAHGSELMQDLIIRHEKNSDWDVQITLEDGSIIHGDVINKTEGHPVQLILRNGEIKGRLRGVELLEEE